MLWLALALMTAAAVFAVLWPLARGQRVDRGASDAVVYRDQLDEIERDRASGTIGAAINALAASQRPEHREHGGCGH